MNNTFNINRFLLLLKRQWLDFGKIYFGVLIVLVGIIIAIYSYFIPTPKSGHFFDYDGNLDMRFRYGLFMLLGFFFISIIASGYYNNLGQKSRAILELMTPASTFEKFLAGIFYTAIVSVFSYLLVFYIVDAGFVKYLNSNLPAFSSTLNKKTSIKDVDGIFYEVINDANYLRYSRYFFVFPFLFTSIFLLGSVYFNRFHYIKTAMAVMIFTGIAGYIIYKIGYLLTQDMVSISIVSKEDSVLQSTFIVTLIITIIMWLITFIRLKEKEV
ncbi:hypothetical protein EZ449_01860 [Pedobacter frigidisoli]|uniref:ABC-2 family transporter protein n=1 Tax=Pedobacter frigidisoli TaxID=2530455 RepID=A0A4V2MNH3_9SPHI|nr:hypothetical protein [Pedobacter frigidisoli]TCD12816.1 hypothetical protein EZ449_01860 [Pedobacter frigidisoli]